MGAGESAAAESDRARRAAARLRRKADYASFVADNFARGALGESVVADALAALEPHGWRILHDRVHPNGGNIDHLAIGPPGIAVIDAKNWTAPVTVTADRRLVSGKHDHTDELRRLADSAEHVRTLTAKDGVQVAVRGYLVLAGEADRQRPPSDVGDLRIIGVENVAKRLDKRGDLDAGLVDAVAATLDVAFPPAGDGAGNAAESLAPRAAAESLPSFAEPSPLFDKAHRFYYLRRWKKGGHDRLYMSDSSGTTMGWTDVNTGSLSIECKGDDAKLVEALLAAADPSGMKLAPGDLPKVATRLFGGRLLSCIARFHTSVLVGQEWRAFGKHRLYGTLIDPAVTTYTLGYVDLKDHTVHPAVDGDLAEDRGPASRYLGFLVSRLPEKP